MRGPTYDDGYITRKLSSLQTSPTFLPPAPSSYGRSMTGGYLQPYYLYRPKRRAYYRVSHLPGGGKETRYLSIPRSRVRYSRSLSPEPLLGAESIPREISVPPSGRSYMPSAQTQLILNRIAVNPRDYPPLPSRFTPRMAPSNYYDYNDYGYGGYGYGAYGPTPRMSRYDAYLDDDYEVPTPAYPPRYSRATRLADAIIDAEKDKQLRRSPVRTTTTTTYTMPPFTHTRNSSPRMLQDEVDKMRIRLKGLSYSLDPSGPVPEIILPERSRRANSVEAARRYTSGPKHLACVEYAGGVPQWKRKARASARYPIEDEGVSNLYMDEIEEDLQSAAKNPERLILKDRLSLKIHSFLGDSMEPDKYERYLKTYRNPGIPPKDAQWREEYYKPKLYKAGDGIASTYSSKYPLKSLGTSASSKWEEPDTIYSSSDKQPYSKTADGDDDDTKKERRKKKKSKERDILAETTSAITSDSLKATGSGDLLAELEQSAEFDDLDDKEKKRLEKKKRKAEREAAAKAAMEAELEALAAAEAELAMLETQTVDAKVEDVPAPVPESEPIAAPTEPEPEALQEQCELVSDEPRELFTDSLPIDESQPSLPNVNDNIFDVEEYDTINDTIDAQPEQTYTETIDSHLDIPPEPIASPQEPVESPHEPIESLPEPIEYPEEPIESPQEPIETPKDLIEYPQEPIESTQEPMQSEPTFVDEPIKTEPELESKNEVEDLYADIVEDTPDTTEQVKKPVIEDSVEPDITDQAEPEQVHEQVADQKSVEEVNSLPQAEEECEEAPKKSFKADTDFDWDAFGTTDTVDTETQQRGGSGGAGGSVGVDDEVVASDDVFEFSDAL